MPKTRRIRKMIQSFLRRLPSFRGRISTPKLQPEAAPTPLPYSRKTVATALATAVVGGLTYQSYRELIREGQEMQLKTTMNLMSLMNSLQSQYAMPAEPQEKDPELLEEIFKVCSAVSEACTTVLGKITPVHRAACYQSLNISSLIRRIHTEPDLLDRSRQQQHEEVVWSSRFNAENNLLIYTGHRIVNRGPNRVIDYYYNFSFKYPFPFTHDRMVTTLTNVVNCFRAEFDRGPWQRANREQLRELETLMNLVDYIPNDPAPNQLDRVVVDPNQPDLVVVDTNQPSTSR